MEQQSISWQAIFQQGQSFCFLRWCYTFLVKTCSSAEDRWPQQMPKSGSGSYWPLTKPSSSCSPTAQLCLPSARDADEKIPPCPASPTDPKTQAAPEYCGQSALFHQLFPVAPTFLRQPPWHTHSRLPGAQTAALTLRQRRSFCGPRKRPVSTTPPEGADSSLLCETLLCRSQPFGREGREQL